MATNRNDYLALNRIVISDEEARQNQGRLDSFINQSLADPARAPLARGPIRVNNNVLTGLFRVFRVMPGTAVVVTGNGQVLEVLTEGSYHALSFPVMNRIDLYVVNVRERTLNIETKQELSLFYQSPDSGEIQVLVDVNVAATYQVIAPDRVALYVEQPVTMLYDTVLESIRSIVAYAKYRDFQAGGNAGYMVAQQLQQRRVEESLGIRVSNVQITSLRGAEQLDNAIREGYLRTQTAKVNANVALIADRNRMQREMEEANNRRDISRLLDLSPQYVALYLPDMYPKLFGDRMQTDAIRWQALIELAKIGVINPSLLTGGDSNALGSTLQHMLTGLPSISSPDQALPSGSFFRANAPDRLREEVAALLQAKMNVTLKEDKDTYYVTVALKDAASHTLDIYFVCTDQYPHQPPTMFLEYDSNQQHYMPDALVHWTPQRSLVDLVEAAITAFT